MKFTKCDKHPDRDAVVTLSIRILPSGARPFLIGLETPKKFVDLCKECKDLIFTEES